VERHWRQAPLGKFEGLYVREAFTTRLMTVSEANKVLSAAGWEASPLPELVEAALKPFRSSWNIHVEGPPCDLPQISCVPLALVLHELATNALKHGALSHAEGRVHPSWKVENEVCDLTWREAHGPPVERPTRRGLGSGLLVRQSGIDQLDLDFQPTGLVCRITVEGANLAAR
jgi:two-component sensor histidine kinase